MFETGKKEKRMNCDTLEILRALKPFVACFFFTSIGIAAAVALWYGAIRHLFFTEAEIALAENDRRLREEEKFRRDLEKALRKQCPQNFPPSEEEINAARRSPEFAKLAESEEWRKFVECAKNIKFTDA